MTTVVTLRPSHIAAKCHFLARGERKSLIHRAPIAWHASCSVYGMKRLFFFALVLALTACSTAPTHNEHGGYIPACGDLPGLVGDDC